MASAEFDGLKVSIACWRALTWIWGKRAEVKQQLISKERARRCFFFWEPYKSWSDEDIWGGCVDEVLKTRCESMYSGWAAQLIKIKALAGKSRGNLMLSDDDYSAIEGFYDHSLHL